MITCPECENEIRGYKCSSCGYVIPKSSMPVDAETIRRKEEIERKALEEAREWLTKRGIINPGMTKGEKMKALAGYRTKCATSKPDYREWAKEIVRDYEEGNYTNYAGYEAACKVINHDKEPVKEVEL